MRLRLFLPLRRKLVLQVRSDQVCDRDKAVGHLADLRDPWTILMAVMRREAIRELQPEREQDSLLAVSAPGCRIAP